MPAEPSADSVAASGSSLGVPIVALLGNPNTGKTSLFNALTGFRRHVANYPGVTVEVATGPVRGAARPMQVVDLPGTYSLAAQSPDERVVAEILSGGGASGRPPDALVVVVDASNLQRNLYLVSQLLECRLPMVVALNMVDIAARRGISVDAKALAQRLGCPVVPINATRARTVAPLVSALESALPGAVPQPPALALPPTMRDALAGLADQDTSGRLGAARVLVDRGGFAETHYRASGGDGAALERARARLTDEGLDAAAEEVRARYAWISEILRGVVQRPSKPVVTWSDRLDQVLTHPVAGLAALIVVLTLCFQALFSGAIPAMEGIEAVFGAVGGWIGPLMPDGAVRSLVVDGVIGGVGGVLVFLPQIMLLFFFIAILEDCGYMARAAFMVDRLMRALGLSGRAFIPLLSSFACAIPGIMGARVIADPRERFVTILIAPFMSCSARLPVYVLLIAAFVPATTYAGGWIGLQGLVMLAMYLVGMVVAIPVAGLLRRTAFTGPSLPFLIELPTYKRPRLRAVWQRMYQAGRDFVVQAGTLILTVNLVVWALAYFPRDARVAERIAIIASDAGWDEERHEAELEGAYLRDSYLGRVGRWIEPAIQPIGWDWRIGMAVIASFPAREVVIGTLGTIFNLGREEDEASPRLRDALAAARWPESGAPIFTLPVALSVMVFFALCAQCTSTLVIIGRELRSWLWPVASFLGMTTIAYVAALGTAAFARAMGLS